MGTQNWVELFSGLDDLSLDYENYNWNKNQILWKKKNQDPRIEITYILCYKVQRIYAYDSDYSLCGWFSQGDRYL